MNVKHIIIRKTGRNVFNILQQKSKARISFHYSTLSANGPMAEEKDQWVVVGEYWIETSRRENVGLKKKAFYIGLRQRKNRDHLGDEGIVPT